MTMHNNRWRRLADAASYALDVHGAQVRKGADTPYIGHLFGVAGLVLEYGGDEDQTIAGLLHDAIEDVGLAQEAIITARFGARVAAIVRGCTDADTFPKPPWLERKTAYLRHLQHASQDILLVSAADKLHNARAIVADLRAVGPVVFERFKAGKDGTLWYYGALADTFTQVLPGPLAVELAQAVSVMRELAPVRQVEFSDPA